MSGLLSEFLAELERRGIIDLSRFKEDFKTRLKVQKLVYIAQCLGLDFGYSFGWYLRGPYSSELADDVYTIAERGTVAREPGKEVADVVRKIEMLGNAQNERWLEALASALFAGRNYGLRGRELVEFLRRQKPWLGEEEIELAVKKLEEIGAI